MKYQSQRGVALVLTLIMLSVITFLTIAFLAVSRRDRASVTTSLNQTDAHLMADTALARMQSEMTTRMMAANSLQVYDTMLTWNYFNPNGFDPALGRNTTNVNYDFYANTFASPLNNNDQIFNIANLFYDPRPPVYVKTNNNTALPLDFRFYLDYNRNRRFETNGYLPVVIDEVGNTNGIFENFLGEPEWIGVLQNPEYPHSPTNRFVGRYLYFALPTSRTLDWNYIHNYAKGNIGMPAQVSLANGDGFLRNQGYGSYEINLAAFLHDLNTNMYPDTPSFSYQYYPDTFFANTGTAFNDAVSFLSYRYGGSIANLSSVNNLFLGNGTTAFSGAAAFGIDLIDGYATRPVLVYPFHNTVDPDLPNMAMQSWPGSRNPNRFFEPQELFNSAKSSLHFVSELNRVSTNNNSYDRYTFSRLLEQIGTGSEPEVKGKININYVNDPSVNTVATNFVAWTPYQFFTNVAERLIKDNIRHPTNPDGSLNTNVFYLFNTTNAANLVQNNISITNIQIYPTNEYSAPLHRLLQLAANIYDATSSNKYPTVFRPRFDNTANSARIFDFVAETNSSFLTNAMASIQNRTNVTNPDGLVWGIPLVLGAKKGFPNFNEFLLQTSVQVSRNLQIIKRDTNSPVTSLIETNQMLVMGISNVFGLEAWNSYIQPYTNSVRFLITNLVTMALTNENGVVIWPANGQPTNYPITTNLLVSYWPGVTSGTSGSNSFIFPFGTNGNFNFLTNSAYRVSTETFVPYSTNTPYERNVGYPTPRWGLTITNRLVYALVDTTEPGGRVIDFVNMDDMRAGIDITEQISNSGQLANPNGQPPVINAMWDTNHIGGSTSINVPTIGMQKQISASMNSPVLSDTEWASYGSQNAPTSKGKSIADFTKFMGFTPTVSGFQNTLMPPYTNSQTPFNPTRRIDQNVSWQVNDPLVHYLADDLVYTNFFQVKKGTNALPNNLGKLNGAYRPWGRTGLDYPGGGEAKDTIQLGGATEAKFAYDFRVKDSRIRFSDDWNFPTNKFSSIGELGRVHRGTPWQTIYLKAATIGTNDWHNWASHVETHPTNDWTLLDAFTVAPNDNAARGLLSVNQANEAAWSAVLSGVVVLTNSLSDAQVENDAGSTNAMASYVIPPGLSISNIVRDINAVRATRPNGVFSSLGEILSVPSLSVYQNAVGIIDASPFLNVTNYNYNVPGNFDATNKVIATTSDGKVRNYKQRWHGVTDEAYERIPRQIASLLKLGEPRFVVYCYGQSLKPAPNSIVLSPPIGSGLFNLCTNYQITGEVVTRTVLRVEGTPQNPKTVIESYNVLPAE